MLKSSDLASVMAIFLLSAKTCISHEVFYDALGPLGGRHALGYEYRPAPSLGIYAKANYEDGQTGALTSLIYPTNIERMYSISGALGVNLFPVRKGLYFSPEIEGGYHSVRLKKRFLPEPDSSKALGPFYAASLRGGYEWRSRWNLNLSPEFGFRYVKNFTNYGRLSEMPATTEDPMPFELNKNDLNRMNNGLQVLVSLLVGYNF